MSRIVKVAIRVHDYASDADDESGESGVGDEECSSVLVRVVVGDEVEGVEEVRHLCRAERIIVHVYWKPML